MYLLWNKRYLMHVLFRNAKYTLALLLCIIYSMQYMLNTDKYANCIYVFFTNFHSISRRLTFLPLTFLDIHSNNQLLNVSVRLDILLNMTFVNSNPILWSVKCKMWVWLFLTNKYQELTTVHNAWTGIRWKNN